jgi:hypothetical protein
VKPNLIWGLLRVYFLEPKLREKIKKVKKKQKSIKMKLLARKKKLTELFLALRVSWWVFLMETQPQYQSGNKKERKKMKTKNMKKYH